MMKKISTSTSISLHKLISSQQRTFFGSFFRGTKNEETAFEKVNGNSSGSVIGGGGVHPMSSEVSFTSSAVAASFPRSVEAAKGAFVGNFPSEGAKLDERHFYNKVPFLRPEASLVEASEFMCTYDVGCVPVLDEKDGFAVIGMLSERDLARWICRSGSNAANGGAPAASSASSASLSSSTPAPSASSNFVNPTEVTVKDIMSTNVIFCTEETTLQAALVMMDQHNFRHLPVMSTEPRKGREGGKGCRAGDDGKSQNKDEKATLSVYDRELVGLLSMRDIMHQHVEGKGKGDVDDFLSWVLKMSR